MLGDENILYLRTYLSFWPTNRRNTQCYTPTTCTNERRILVSSIE